MEEITSINNEIKGENIPPRKFFSKERKKNLILFGITILVMILFFEIILRMYYPQRLYNDCYEYSYRNLSNLEVELDSHLGWKLIPNFSGCGYQPDTNKIITKTHNSNGLRIDKDIPYENNNGKKRVLLLGDSFVYGYGLDDEETIALKLQEDFGQDYEIINMGVDGYGTGQEILQFYEQGIKYNPDVVMLFFYPNDFTENKNEKIAFSGGPLFHSVDQIKVAKVDDSKKLEYIVKELTSEKPEIVFFDSIVNPDKQNYTLDNETIILSNYPNKMLWNDKQGPNKKPLYLNNPISAIPLKYSHFYSLIFHKLSYIESTKRIEYSDRISDNIDIFYELIYGGNAQVLLFIEQKIIKEFKREADQNNFKFVVIGIPEKRGVSEKYQQKFLSLYSDVTEDDFEFKKIDRIFDENLQELNIEYISLYNLAEENLDEFYFKTDAHWNPNGVKLSADYITGFVYKV